MINLNLNLNLNLNRLEKITLKQYIYVLLLCGSLMILDGCTPEKTDHSESSEEMPTCTLGNEGCACKEDGTCNTLGGISMICQENQCVLPQENQGGQEPSDSNPTLVSSLKIEPDQARGCEVVLLDPENMIQNVLFNSTVKGHWMRRDDRIALAFFTQENQAIEQGAISFESSITSLDLQMLNLKCVDVVGEELTNASLSFE